MKAGESASARADDLTSDEDLILKMRSVESKEEASAIGEQLINRYRDMVRRIARMYYLAGGDPEDLMQEGMLGLYKAITTYQDDRQMKFSSFAYLCIERQIQSAVRNSNRQKHQAMNEAISLDQMTRDEEGNLTRLEDVLSDENSLSVEEKVQGQLDGEELLEQLKSRLSELEQNILGPYLNGENYRQIAETLGLVPKIVDNALQRIKKKAKELLKEE